MKKRKDIVRRPDPGRPAKIITDDEWKFINQMLQAQCDGASIARQFGLHPQTFYDKVVERYGEEMNIANFTEYQAIKRRQGLELLRNKQFELAMVGDRTMLVWLGKQLLGQRDQIEQTITVPQVTVQTFDEKDALDISTALTALEEHESNERISTEPESDREQ